MNLFRSEEHVLSWSEFDPVTSEGILALDDLVTLFSVAHFTRRLDSDYVSQGMHANELLASLRELGHERPFWSPT